MERSESKRISQVTSVVTRRIDLYSASAKDNETEVCFLDFQETGEPPKLIKKPLIDLRVCGQDPQSESQKARS